MRQGYHKELRDNAYGAASKGRKVYPPRDLVFNSMHLTPFEEVRVVILSGILPNLVTKQHLLDMSVMITMENILEKNCKKMELTQV